MLGCYGVEFQTVEHEFPKVADGNFHKRSKGDQRSGET